MATLRHTSSVPMHYITNIQVQNTKKIEIHMLSMSTKCHLPEVYQMLMLIPPASPPLTLASSSRLSDVPALSWAYKWAKQIFKVGFSIKLMWSSHKPMRVYNSSNKAVQEIERDVRLIVNVTR